MAWFNQVIEELPPFVPSQSGNAQGIASHCSLPLEERQEHGEHPYLGADSQGVPKSGNSMSH